MQSKVFITEPGHKAAGCCLIPQTCTQWLLQELSPCLAHGLLQGLLPCPTSVGLTCKMPNSVLMNKEPVHVFDRWHVYHQGMLGLGAGRETSGAGCKGRGAGAGDTGAEGLGNSQGGGRGREQSGAGQGTWGRGHGAGSAWASARRARGREQGSGGEEQGARSVGQGMLGQGTQGGTRVRKGAR